MSHRSFILLPILLLQLRAVAQKHIESGFGIEANVLSGRIIKHSARFTAPIPTLSKAIDVDLVWRTNGRRPWHQHRRYPQIGLGITYTDYGNSKVFGSCIGVYPSLQVPLLKMESFEWTLRLGNGVGYVTKKYTLTPQVDTVNTAIGSHLNDYGIFLMDFRHHFSDQWHLQYGFNFTHISNGGTRQPNLGVNMAGVHAGITYYPETCRPKPVDEPTAPPPGRWLLQMKMDFSYKQARAAGNPILPSYMPSLYVSHRWKGKNKVYLGADYAFHNDVLAFMRYYDVHAGRQKQESWDGGVFVGNEFLVGRVGIITQLGFYYKQTFLKFDPVYEKIGGNLYIIQREKGLLKEAFISCILLTHAATAELVEFGIGAGFGKSGKKMASDR